MDSKGFLPLSLIASFSRIQAVTTDVDLIKEAITKSKKLEYGDGYKVSQIYFIRS